MKKFIVSAALAVLGISIIGQTTASEKQLTVVNAKQLSIGFMMYATDHDGWLPNAPSTTRYQQVVFPYCKNNNLWKSKNPAGGSLTFNSSVGGANLISLERPEGIAMIYDSKPWKDGSRVVGFVDGRALDVDQAKWKEVEKSLHTKVAKRAKALPK